MVAIVDHGGASSVAVGAGQVWKILPHGLFFVLRHPPLGKDFLDVQLSHDGSPLWLKFSSYVLNRNARELEGHPLLCVGEIVVSMRQISIAHKAAGGRSGEIREGNGVSPGVGLIDESKGKRVRGSEQRIFTSGAHVSRIFMQGNTRQEARCSLGSDRGDGISIEPTEGPSSVLPFAGVMVCWIGHAQTSLERREDNSRGPKCLMGVDCKFIAEGQTLRTRRDRQEE